MSEVTTTTATTTATKPANVAATEMAFNIAMFAMSTAITVAMAYFLFADPSRLADIWTWIRGLNILIQLVLWLLFLPWMIALWIWTQPWAIAIRLLLVLGILGFAEYLLFPWKP